jgi:hypothetical protein
MTVLDPRQHEAVGAFDARDETDPAIVSRYNRHVLANSRGVWHLTSPAPPSLRSVAETDERRMSQIRFGVSALHSRPTPLD